MGRAGGANARTLWEGRSAFDGRPIVAIATGLTRTSQNTKTGDMIQIWILPRWISPARALDYGADASVCGSCPLRSGACYVRIHTPLSVWRAYHRHPRRHLEPADIVGRVVRLGAYGDPAALPLAVWEELLPYTAGHTGYTHAWRTCDPAYRGILMASCDTPADYRDARATGWRTFRSRLWHEALLPGEIACPASAEAGHRTTCADCGLCDGSRGSSDGRRDITILAHGSDNVMHAYTRVRAGLRVIA